MMSGKVKSKSVEVLRDSGCHGVICKRELMEEADFTGEVSHTMTMEQTLKNLQLSVRFVLRISNLMFDREVCGPVFSTSLLTITK